MNEILPESNVEAAKRITAAALPYEMGRCFRTLLTVLHVGSSLIPIMLTPSEILIY